MLCYEHRMRILVGLIALTAACGGPAKKESSMVNEGSDTPPTCCCKTIPVTAEKEIIPVYAMAGRMECSTSNGECVDDVQCNASRNPDQATKRDNGVPPPAPIAPLTNDGPIQ